MNNFLAPLVLLFAFFANASALADEYFDLAQRFFKPLPDSMPGAENDTAQQIALGRALYFETGLSANNNQSCNSCHNLANSGNGVDHLPTSVGSLGKLGVRNSPTTWNAGLQFAQFWDGRVTTLEEQARSPLLNPDEMALSGEVDALQRLEALGYRDRFDSAFPDQAESLAFDNILNALAAFQRTLITKDRFDVYLKGDQSALTNNEKRGLKRFIWIGCNACHSGALLGGDSFMKLGTANPYPNREDTGRAQVTGKSGDRFFFKVPPLRNTGQTGPYFHDGAGKTLEETVKGTAWHQLSVELSDEDVDDISAFLRTMNNLRPLTTSGFKSSAAPPASDTTRVR